MLIKKLWIIVILVISMIYYTEISNSKEFDVEKVNISIHGFFLGENMDSLFKRAKESKIEYEYLGDTGDMSPYAFNVAFDHSKDIDHVTIAISNGYVKGITTHYKDASDVKFSKIIEMIIKQWGVEPRKDPEQKDRYEFFINNPPVIITLKRELAIYPRELMIKVEYDYWFDDPDMVEAYKNEFIIK